MGRKWPTPRHRRSLTRRKVASAKCRRWNEVLDSSAAGVILSTRCGGRSLAITCRRHSRTAESARLQTTGKSQQQQQCCLAVTTCQSSARMWQLRPAAQTGCSRAAQPGQRQTAEHSQGVPALCQAGAGCWLALQGRGPAAAGWLLAASQECRQRPEGRWRRERHPAWSSVGRGQV